MSAVSHRCFPAIDLTVARYFVGYQAANNRQYDYGAGHKYQLSITLTCICGLNAAAASV